MKKESQQIKANDESDCKGSFKSVIFCIRKPGKRSYESQCSWSAKAASTQEPRVAITTNNPPKARTQHATQDGTMTKLGLLKSGTLMIRLTIGREHQLFALNESKATAIHHRRRRSRIGIVVGIQIILGLGE